jgi:hypothetical protein
MAGLKSWPTPNRRAISARQPGWRRAIARSLCSSGSSSRPSSSIMRAPRAASVCPAGDSSAASSRSRPLSDHSCRPGSTPCWKRCACKRCCQAVRSSRSALRVRTSTRSSEMWKGGIQASGSSPRRSSRSSSWQSAASVFARRFLPRRAAVSAGSARWAVSPARSISSTMKRQPVVASRARCASVPWKRRSHLRTGSRAAGVMRPRLTSAVSRLSVFVVICLRWTSSAPTICIGTSSSSVGSNDIAWYHA